MLRWHNAAVAAALLGLSAPLRAQGAPPKKIAGSIARLFGPGSVTDTVQTDSDVVLRIRQSAHSVGYALVRNVTGKDQPITFLVAVDSSGLLKDVDILVYREPYGGEVAYDAWRKQFRGKSAADPLVIGRDIRSISGATISSNSVTLGIRTALADLARWRADGRLK